LEILVLQEDKIDENEVFDPSGFSESMEPSYYATRLTDLKGKTIGEISNGEHGGWEVDRTFPMIRQLLEKRFPDIKIIPYTEFLRGLRELTSIISVTLYRPRGCNAVIGVMLAEVHVPRPSAAPWQELRKKESRLSQLHVKVLRVLYLLDFRLWAWLRGPTT